MNVYIKALKQEGFPYVVAARRFFEPGATVKMEILDQDDDPPDTIKVTPEHGPRPFPDMERMGRRSFEEIKNDGRFNVFSDMESQAAITRESLEGAMAEAAKHASRAIELEAENAALKAQLAKLTAPAADAGGGDDKGKKASK